MFIREGVFQYFTLGYFTLNPHAFRLLVKITELRQ